MIRQPLPGVSGTVKTFLFWLFIWWRVDHCTPATAGQSQALIWEAVSFERLLWSGQVLGFFPDLSVLKAGFLCKGTKGQSSSLVFEYQCALMNCERLKICFHSNAEKHQALKSVRSPYVALPFIKMWMYPWNEESNRFLSWIATWGNKRAISWDSSGLFFFGLLASMEQTQQREHIKCQMMAVVLGFFLYLLDSFLTEYYQKTLSRHWAPSSIGRSPLFFREKLKP